MIPDVESDVERLILMTDDLEPELREVEFELKLKLRLNRLVT